MALISCPGCGNQVSDKAPVCPHCGIAIAAPPTPNYGAPMPVYIQPPRKSSVNKPAVIVAIAAVIAVIGVVLFFLLTGSGGGGDSGGAQITTTANNPFSSTEPEEEIKTYAVYMSVKCEKSSVLFWNQYDVDIVVDGVTVYTLAHGKSWTDTLYLTEGIHTVTFHENGDPTVNSEPITIKVSEDTGFTCGVHCHGDYVEVKLQ